jgi:hypothetical protein
MILRIAAIKIVAPEALSFPSAWIVALTRETQLQGLRKYILDLLEEAPTRRILDSCTLDSCQLLQKIPFLVRELLGHMHEHADVLITSSLRITAQDRNAFVLQTKHLTGRGSSRNLELDLTLERWNFYL